MYNFESNFVRRKKSINSYLIFKNSAEFKHLKYISPFIDLKTLQISAEKKFTQGDYNSNIRIVVFYKFHLTPQYL